MASNSKQQQGGTQQQQQGVEILENWEDFESTDVLDKGLKSLVTSSANITLNGTNKSNGCASTRSPLEFLLSKDDATLLNNPYNLAQPTVKILKRPTRTSSENADTTKTTRQQPMKTLQQREQEYAEARLRIMGNVTMESTDEKYKIQNNSNSGQIMHNENNVIRWPKGPDGTKGFTMRR